MHVITFTYILKLQIKICKAENKPEIFKQILICNFKIE